MKKSYGNSFVDSIPNKNKIYASGIHNQLQLYPSEVHHKSKFENRIYASLGCSTSSRSSTSSGSSNSSKIISKEIRNPQLNLNQKRKKFSSFMMFVICFLSTLLGIYLYREIYIPKDISTVEAPMNTYDDNSGDKYDNNDVY